MNAMLVAALATAAAVAATAIAFAPSNEIRTEVTIDASPDQVWSVLIDGASYSEWNPFIVGMEGDAIKGGTLVNTMQPAGGSRMVFRPTVLEAAPGRELRWLGRLLAPRIFDGEHYFLLEAKDGGTRLVHGEKFRGVLLWVMGTGGFRADFERMNAALKARVESRGIASL